MSATIVNTPSAQSTDSGALGELEAAFAAPAATRTTVDPPAAVGLGELLVLASFASLAVGFVVLVVIAVR